MGGLDEYVRQMLARGYSAQAIRSSLIQQGYAPDEATAIVEAAAKSSGVRDQGMVRRIEVSPKNIVYAGIAILLIIGLFFIISLIFSGDGGGNLPQYSIVLHKNRVSPGDDLLFTNRLISKEDYDAFDVHVQYRISNIYTGEILSEWAETIEVGSTAQENSRSQKIGSDAKSGKYRLSALISRDEDKAYSYADFIIFLQGQKPTCFDGMQNQEETDIDCGGPCQACAEKQTCFDGILNQDEEAIDCGGVCRPCLQDATCSDNIRNQDEEAIDCGGVCSPCTTDQQPTAQPSTGSQSELDILLQAKNIMNSDAGSAEGLCESIRKDPRIRDDCYHALAQGINQSEYCLELASESKKDLCFMWFVHNKDYSVCEHITNVYIRKNCESMRNIMDLMDKENSQNMTRSG